MALSIVAIKTKPGRGRAARPWRARALDVCRVSAIVAAVMAPASTAATSIATVVFLVSLIVSGAALQVVSDAFRLPAGKGIVAFLALVLASALLNDAGVRAAIPDLWAWRKVAFVYLALPLFSADVWKRRLVLSVFWAFAALLAMSYVSLAGWIPTRDVSPMLARGVVMTNYAAQGVALAVAALLGASLAQSARARWRWIYALLCAAFIVNVLFFGPGRTGYLAIAALGLLWALLSGGWRTAFAAAGGLAILAAIAFAVSPTFKPRLAVGWEEMQHAEEARTETSMGIRLLFAQNALALIAERPLLGYGLGSFKRVYADYVASRYTGVKATPSGDPHNQYLYVLFEQGAVGLAVFLFMIGSLFVTFPRDHYGRLAACVLTAWCLTSVFSSHFRTYPEGHFYAFVVAGLGGAARRRPGAFTGARDDRVHRDRASRHQVASHADPRMLLEYSSGVRFSFESRS